jgi:hypothetical protein
MQKENTIALKYLLHWKKHRNFFFTLMEKMHAKKVSLHKSMQDGLGDIPIGGRKTLLYGLVDCLLACKMRTHSFSCWSRRDDSTTGASAGRGE